MASTLVPVADGFWNIRGPFRVGPVNIGTQASLARRADGSFVLLDSYLPDPPVLDEIRALTDGGDAIGAIVNLHPFHTVFVKKMHAAFPGATLHGTARHIERAPDLPWHEERSENPALHQRFADDFEFSVPRGVDFIPSDPKLHFSSVIAIHRASRTLHVDDTLSFNPLPLVGGVLFHPTLKRVLQKRPGAAAEFREWAESLVELCEGVDHLCTAHVASPARYDGSVADAVRRAYRRARKTIDAHERRWG